MNLDEAIIHCEKVADGMTKQGECKECADEHRQLAEWLKELKRFRLMKSIEQQIKELNEIKQSATQDALAEMKKMLEQKWIPCSERLPEKNGIYIVTERVFSVGDYCHAGGFRIEVEPVDFYKGEFMRAPFYEVVAWMPLPAPYRPREE